LQQSAGCTSYKTCSTLSAVIVGLLSKEQALSDLLRLLDQGIRISPRWQAWFRSEIDAL